MFRAAKYAGTTNMWSSSRRLPSGKRIPCSSSSARRNSLCGVSRLNGAARSPSSWTFSRNRLRGTALWWPTTLPITMSASSAIAVA